MSDDGFEVFQAGSKAAQNDPSLQGVKVKKFHPKEGEIYRVSFALWPTIEKDGRKIFDMDADGPIMAKAPTHFMDGVGYFVSRGPEYVKLAGKDAETRVGTVVISWPVLPNGKPDVEMFQLGRYEVLPYVFSSKKYSEYDDYNNLHHLGKIDLQIRCENTRFQHLKIKTYQECLLRTIMERKPGMFEEIMEKVAVCFKQIKPLVAQSLSMAEIQKRLERKANGGTDSSDTTLPSASPAAALGADEELDSLLEGIV
jgi:hypothetical protein